MNVFLNRVLSMVSDLSQTDSQDRPTLGAVACTAFSHQALAAITCGSFIAGGAGACWAAVYALAAWGLWELVQYIRTPSIRTLRDGILGDGVSYTIGAAGASVVASLWPLGLWPVWAGVVAALGINPVVQAAVFGRTPEEAAA